MRSAALIAGAAAAAVARPVPTAPLLQWQEDEIGVIIHFNMATFAGSQGCGKRAPPSVSKFNPTKLSTEQWANSMVDLGAKYAVYVAKHGCGFAAWPTNVSFPFLPGPGGSYGYSVSEAPVKTDVAGSFAASCRKRNIKPGFYYSLGSNSYTKYQLGLNDEQFNEVVMAQVKELWGNYGDLGEIWFDGGYSAAIKQNLTEALGTLQPNAVVFQGYGVAKSPVRWIGTEAGNAPYPDWSTSTGNNPGAGSADGQDWVPGECDTTLQENDQWFYRKNWPIRSLKELQGVYHGTVGRNGNLLLDMAPTPDGVLDDLAVQRYKEFGDWIRSCYGPGQEINSTAGGATVELYLTNKTHPGAGAAVDRVVIQENQTAGEVIRSYKVTALTPTGWVTVATGSSVGNKRIDIFSSGTVAAVTRLRLTVTGDGSGAVPVVKNFAAYGPYNCGGAAPPQPHDCGVAAAGQKVGFFPCTYGAHQKWSMEDAGGGKVTLQLQGLSVADKPAMCLTVTALNAEGGSYTNATVLADCDGSAAQLWQYSDLQQLTHVVGGQVGCLDCADCQKDGSSGWVYTPCYGGGKGSGNEEFNYDPDVMTVSDKQFHKCLGICSSK